MNRRERLGAAIDQATARRLHDNWPLHVKEEALQSDVRPDHVGRRAWLTDLDSQDGREPRGVPIEGLRLRLIRLSACFAVTGKRLIDL